MRKRVTCWHTWSKVTQLFSGKGGFHVHTSRFIWITATAPIPLSAPLFSVELLELCTHSKISMLNVCQGRQHINRQMQIHVLGLEFPSHLYISRLATNMLCKGPICISQLNPVTVLSELSALKEFFSVCVTHLQLTHAPKNWEAFKSCCHIKLVNFPKPLPINFNRFLGGPVDVSFDYHTYCYY